MSTHLKTGISLLQIPPKSGIALLQQYSAVGLQNDAFSLFIGADSRVMTYFWAQRTYKFEFLYLVSFPPLLLRGNTRRLALNSLYPILPQLLYFNEETKEHMSYCMLVETELGLSALNVYPMSFARYGGNPIRIETCGRLVRLTQLPCLFRCQASSQVLKQCLLFKIEKRLVDLLDVKRIMRLLIKQVS